MKSAKFITLLLILALSVFYCSDPSSSGNDRPQVIVDEDITVDTVWESGKDYVVRGRVEISEGAVLEISGGARIYYDNTDETVSSYLKVLGNIVAISENSPIEFGLLQNQTPAAGKYYLELTGNDEDNRFKKCQFSNLLYGINANDARLDVRGCTFSLCDYGIYASKIKYLLIDECKFANNSISVILDKSYASADTNVIIQNSQWEGSSEISIAIENEITGKICHNIFKEDKLSVRVLYKSMIDIYNNYFKDCSICLEVGVVYGHPKVNVFNNTFEDFQTHACKFVSSVYPIVNSNNFLVSAWNLATIILEGIVGDTEPKSIDLRNNYWGTTIEEDISQLIQDTRIFQSATKEQSPILIDPILTSIDNSAYPSSMIQE
jgi:hypothetical protein